MREESCRTHDVFLSYSSKDKTWADAACAVLEGKRIRCWIAPRDITPGDEWGAAIIEGLNGSRLMVLIFSGHANDSEQVRREVERAISQGMTILPVRVEDVRPAGAMEYALGNRHWLDAFTPPVEQQLEKLARSVQTLLGKGVESGAAPHAGEAYRGSSRKSPDVAPPRMTPRMWSSVIVGVLILGLLAAWLGGAFKVKTPDRVVGVDNIPKESDPAATKPINETTLGRDKKVPPIAATAPQSDQERVQGRWQAVEVVTVSNVLKKAFASQIKPVWTFQRTHLTIHGDPYAKDFDYLGLFSLSASVEHRLFGYSFKSRNGKSLEWLGIYEFEDEFLRVCFESFPAERAPHSKRPDSFVVTPGTKQVCVKLRRIADR